MTKLVNLAKVSKTNVPFLRGLSDVCNVCCRIINFTKAFDLVNHLILLANVTL